MIYRLAVMLGDSLDVAIIAMMVACALPFVWAVVAKLLGGFRAADNKAPRVFLDKLSGRAAYAHAAQANSFETLPMFLAGVILAMYCFVPQHVVNALAWLYVGVRVLYGWAYVMGASTLRSILWSLSMICIAMLYVLAIKMV